MFTHKNIPSVAASLLIIIGLLFSGCGTTDSSEEKDEDKEEPQPTFNSGNISHGETFNQTFENEGLIEYYCELHAPNMQGEITVTSSVESAERDTISMANHSFQPSDLSVAPNTEIVWVNGDSDDHTVVSGNPSSDDDSDDSDDGGGY